MRPSPNGSSSCSCSCSNSGGRARRPSYRRRSRRIELGTTQLLSRPKRAPSRVLRAQRLRLRCDSRRRTQKHQPYVGQVGARFGLIDSIFVTRFEASFEPRVGLEPRPTKRTVGRGSSRAVLHFLKTRIRFECSDQAGTLPNMPSRKNVII